MKKFTSLFLVTSLVFVISSCSKTEETAPVTVVGVWKVGGLGVITDTKTVDATIDEIKKIDATVVENLATQTYEFKADGTSIIPVLYSSSNATTDVGKYVVSVDGKTITITSNTQKDSKGNLVVQSFEITKLSSTELKFGLSKVSKKNADGRFSVDPLTIDFATIYYGIYVFTAKGLDPIAEQKAAKTLQATYNLKK